MYGTVRSTRADAVATYLDFGAEFNLLSYELDLTAIARASCVAVVGHARHLDALRV